MSMLCVFTGDARAAVRSTWVTMCGDHLQWMPPRLNVQGSKSCVSATQCIPCFVDVHAVAIDEHAVRQLALTLRQRALTLAIDRVLGST